MRHVTQILIVPSLEYDGLSRVLGAMALSGKASQ